MTGTDASRRPPARRCDPQGIHDLRAVLRDRAAQGHTIFVSSHLLAEVELLAEDLAVRLVAAAGSGSLEEMFLRWTSDETKEKSRRSRLIPTAVTTRKEVVS